MKLKKFLDILEKYPFVYDVVRTHIKGSFGPPPLERDRIVDPWVERNLLGVYAIPFTEALLEDGNADYTNTVKLPIEPSRKLVGFTKVRYHLDAHRIGQDWTCTIAPYWRILTKNDDGVVTTNPSKDATLREIIKGHRDSYPADFVIRCTTVGFVGINSSLLIEVIPLPKGLLESL